MNMRRVASGTFGLLLFLASSVAAATAYEWPEPGRNIQAIIPAQSGSGVGNSVARLILDALSAQLGNRVVLQHYISSNSLPGSTAPEANTEGYTLLFASVDTLVIEPGLTRAGPAEPQNAFAPIGLVASSPHVLVVNHQIPVHSVREL